MPQALKDTLNRLALKRGYRSVDEVLRYDYRRYYWTRYN